MSLQMSTFWRVARHIASCEQGRRRLAVSVAHRSVLLSQLCHHATQNDGGSQHGVPQLSSSPPKPRKGKGAKNHPNLRLSPLSLRVRHYLAANPPLPIAAAAAATEGSRDGEAGEEQRVLDELLYLLLSCHSDGGRPAVGAAAKVPGGATVTAVVANPLHPLLCVRVLQRLGYAVCTQDIRCHGVAQFPVKGWTTRHVYPSLATCGATAGATAQTLADLASVVLCPLLPLLGDGTCHRPPHTQVAPVVPVVVEWLCTLPTSEAALPLQSWLPWVVMQYRSARSCCDTQGGEDDLDKTMAEGKGDAMSASPSREKAGVSSRSLPLLKELLPLLIRKLAPHLSSVHEELSPASTGNDAPLSMLCETQLSALFGLCENSTSVCGRSSAGSANAGAPSCCNTLSELLWWSGDEPLVHLPGVRRALSQLVLQEVDSVDVLLPPLPSSSSGRDTVSKTGSMGSNVIGNGPPGRAATSLSASPTVNGVSRVQMLVTETRAAVTASAIVPQLTVRLSDDDVYRRFLLRLTALQHALLAESTPRRRHQAPNTASETLVLLSIELSDSLSKGGAATAGLAASPEEDPDVILRFIQPLYEYVVLLEDNSPGTPAASASTATRGSAADSGRTTSLTEAPVRLAFTTVLNVLTAIFRRFEELKQQSSCRLAAAANSAQRNNGGSSIRISEKATSPAAEATTAYTLLPQKARLHTLKRLCEVLLHHVRSVAASRQRLSTQPSMEEKDATALFAQQPWFVEVDVRQQEAVLRRLCGAARALVRVVMEERRRSLAEEGPEGSVLTASSITAAQRSRRPSDVFSTAGLGSDGNRSLAAAAATGLREKTTTTAASSVASFDQTLRTLAFRVVEPALWTLYDTCAEHQLAPPVHVLAFEDWLSYLTSVLREESCSAVDDEGRGAAAEVRTGDVPAELQSCACVMRATWSLYESVGGRAGLQTAQQVLPRPGQQSISALVEGIRLSALRCFLFDDLRDGFSSPSLPPNQTGEYTEMYTRWVMEHTSAAFFSMWQRASAPSAAASLGTSVEHEVEGQRQLRRRLGLLTLALHVHILLARQRLRRTQPFVGDVGEVSPSFTDSDAAAASLPSSLLSLLQCLLFSESTTSPTRLPRAPVYLDAANGHRDEWTLVIGNGSILEACHRPPPGTPSGCASLWELAEELQELAANAADEATCTTWRWLGSPEALWGAAEAASSSRLFLLPWTTAAHSHQLLRVYDESGQSQRAAQEWEATLQVWLAGGSGVHNASQASTQLSRPVVRIVSIAEELRFFAALQHQPVVQLTSTMRVVSMEMQNEVAVVAPAVRRQLRSSEQRQARLADTAMLRTENGWYGEDDYDGLD